MEAPWAPRGVEAAEGGTALSVNATRRRAVSVEKRGAQTRHLRLAGGEPARDRRRLRRGPRLGETETDALARPPSYEGPPGLAAAGDEQLDAIGQRGVGRDPDPCPVQGHVADRAVEIRQKGRDAESAAQADAASGSTASVDHERFILMGADVGTTAIEPEADRPVSFNRQFTLTLASGGRRRIGRLDLAATLQL
jgi:hypothetical protein